MAQLVERWIWTPEVGGSIPVIGEIYIEHLLSTVLKNENKEEAGNWPIFENI